jgi:hypothetical protein
VPAIASKTAPTRTELDAGTDLTGDIAAMAGFDPTSATVAVPDLSTRFESQIDGAITVSTSTLTMYLSDDSQDVREVLPRGTNGWVVALWEGDVSGRMMDVFPARVISAAKDPTTTNAGQITITFAITAEPAENVAVPA